MIENTALWDRVCTTDPSATKPFQKGGGFKGTAIKPYWLMRKATEVFGPCGIKWGWTEIENKMVGGVWCSKIRLWYMVDDKGRIEEGKIEQWGQTVMEGSNKNGPFVDEEAPKKAITDAVTKCLSYLGFGGDVHMGLFDDSKYVQEVKAEYAEHESKAKSPFKNASLRNQFADNVIKSFDDAQSLNDLEVLVTLNGDKFKEMDASGFEADALVVEELRKRYKLAKSRFNTAPKDEFLDGGRVGLEY